MDFEPDMVQPSDECSGQVGIDAVCLPRLADLRHALWIVRIPGDAIPIGVHDKRPSAVPEDTIHLGKSAIRIV